MISFCLFLFEWGTDAAAIPDECSVCVCVSSRIICFNSSTFHVMTSLGLVQLPHEWSSLS